MNTTTEEKREAIPNSVSRMVFAGLGVLLQVLWLCWLAFKLNNYSTIIQFCTSVLAFLITLRIYGLHINAAYKISWIILISAFPVFGLTIYFLFGQSGAVRSIRKRHDANLALLQTYHAPILNRRKALPYPDRITRNHAYYLQHRAHYPAYDNTDVTFYGDTCEALEAQKAALRSAEKFIFMEYHAIEDASAWQEIEDILAERAAHGVEVRVFYDDVGSIGFITTKFVKKLEARGIRCRCFNPVIPILNVFMNNRDHRKITVVDGRVGFTGGYNLAEEYFNRTHPYGQWKDSGVRLEGDAVRSLTLIFLELWGTTQKDPPEVERYLPEVPYTAKENGVVIPYADNPLDDEATGENVYLNMIRSAKDYVYITTPYLILSDEMQRALRLASTSGVDVRIITPGIPDKKMIFSVTRSYYAALARSGVRIYEYAPGFIHAKQCVADGQEAVVGTINLDFRSLYLHFENACWFCGCQAVADVRRDFDALFPVCREVTDEYARRSMALRGRDCVLRLFSPLM
ncbi:cardiolipin synthase [Gemmiger sp.]